MKILGLIIALYTLVGVYTPTSATQMMMDYRYLNNLAEDNSKNNIEETTIETGKLSSALYEANANIRQANRKDPTIKFLAFYLLFHKLVWEVINDDGWDSENKANM